MKYKGSSWEFVTDPWQVPFAVEKSAETKFRAPDVAVIPSTSFALLFSDISPSVSSSTKSPF